MRKFGLIGFPLSHSFSKNYFSKKFEKENIADTVYDLYPISSIQEYPDLVSEIGSDLRGLNVTIPYKQVVIPYLTELDPAALAIGAVNTILFSRSGTRGYNTDALGFEASLTAILTKPFPTGIILGNGGAAKAIKYVFKKLGIPYFTLSRKSSDETIAYEAVTKDLIKSNLLIVNTTPLGMYPNLESYPAIDYNLLGPQHILYDLVYNPQKTVFLSKGETRGCKIFNGMDMLIRQAEASWKIWNS